MRLSGLLVLAAVLSEVHHVHAFQNPSVNRRSLVSGVSSPWEDLGQRSGLVRASPSSSLKSRTHLRFSQNAQNEDQQVQEEESLSDVDARVLREMLQESKLDLKTEDDIKKLLERGTVKSTVNPKEQALKEEKERKEASPFESSVLQTFTDTVLWKKVSAKAEDLLESAKIWVANKVEQDLQVAAALGLFAWERAVRDVARALPATASVVTPPKPKTPLSLSNSSSFQETAPKTASSLRDNFSRPEDEIKDVSRAIWGILQGDETAKDQRGLRSVAKAGTVNAADRQRRAFTQRRKLDRRDRDLSRVAGSVMDATYELQRELKAETSEAGYKTKRVRKAIAAGTTAALTAVKETARLAAAKRKETLMLRQAAVNRTVVYTQLVEERAAMLKRLSACISTPQNTWLASPDEILAEATRQMTEDQLREVATLLVVVRSDISSYPLDAVDVTDAPGTTVSREQVQEVLKILRADVQALQELGSRVEQDVSSPVANALYASIVGIPRPGQEVGAVQPLLLRLDEVEASIQVPLVGTSTETEEEVDLEMDEPRKNAVFFADAIVNESVETTATGWVAAEATVEDFMDVDVAENTVETAQVEEYMYVDVVPEVIWQAGPVSSDLAEVITDDDAEQSTASFNYKTFAAEVVSDEDVDTAFGGAKEVRNLSEEEIAFEEVEEEPNIAVMAALRVLDVVFYVFEKSFTVVLPATVQYSVTAAQRYGEVKRSGQGQKGWELLRRSADAKGRY